jgi:hypothetical protein
VREYKDFVFVAPEIRGPEDYDPFSFSNVGMMLKLKGWK